MLKNILIILCAVFTICGPACTQPKQTATYSGLAVKIIDGDTFDLLMDNNQRVRIRLHGVDCPERGMDYYKVAKETLGNLCAGQRVKVIRRDRDQYGRMVADVYNSSNQWINLELVKTGCAWHYTHYDHDKRLDDAEQSARAGKIGLWSLDNPTPPWEWRKAKRERAKQSSYPQ